MAHQLKYHKLQDKHVFIIGGSSGIGYAIAEASIESGAVVTISSSRQAKLDASVSSLQASYPGARVTGIAADLGKPILDHDLDALFKAATATSGQIHHVVYTAADPLSLGPLEETTTEGILKAAHMRMVAPIMLGKVAPRYLEKTPQSSITMTTGSTAERPDKGWAVITYFAAGLYGLTRALATDLAPLRVNCVSPGVVDTSLWDSMGEEAKRGLLAKISAEVPLGRVGKVEDVAEAYLWLMKDSNVTGTVASTNGGQFLKA
jgi:NAD(P)-dependent dehydrogenase (short-subunit alcohol dehydrogenase family)